MLRLPCTCCLQGTPSAWPLPGTLPILRLPCWPVKSASTTNTAPFTPSGRPWRCGPLSSPPLLSAPPLPPLPPCCTGRGIVSELRGKELVMRLMMHPDPDVQSQALKCVQKVLLSRDKADFLAAAS